MNFTTLLDVLERNRAIDRSICYRRPGGSERKLPAPAIASSCSWTTATNRGRLATLAQRTDEAMPFSELALIQFSSGSTMGPKGVILTHRNLVANTRDVLEVGKSTDRDLSAAAAAASLRIGRLQSEYNQ